MKEFTRLLSSLDQYIDEGQKVSALIDYFKQAEDPDRLWCIAILLGKRPKRVISGKELFSICKSYADLPQWLIDVCFQQVGDMTETISLIFPNKASDVSQGLQFWIERLEALRILPEEEKATTIASYQDLLPPSERFIFNKLLIGGFRFEVSQKVMAEALSSFLNRSTHALSFLLNLDWHPSNIDFRTFIDQTSALQQRNEPIPMRPFQDMIENEVNLGSLNNWYIENYWEGERCQLIINEGEILLWAQDGAYLTEKVPELNSLISILPKGINIEGILVGMKNGQVLPAEHLVARLKRKKVTKSHIKECPISFIAIDLLKAEDTTVSQQSLQERKKLLERIIDDSEKTDGLSYTTPLDVSSWEEVANARANARSLFSSGLLLRRKSGKLNKAISSDYWLWKVPPFTTDAVLLYISRSFQTGNYEYTLAAWQGDALIPITKVESNLKAEDEKLIAEFAKSNTIEKFGPVRSITPHFVLKISFHEIVVSKRHKCGIRLVNPYIEQLIPEKSPEDATTLLALNEILNTYGASASLS